MEAQTGLRGRLNLPEQDSTRQSIDGDERRDAENTKDDTVEEVACSFLSRLPMSIGSSIGGTNFLDTSSGAPEKVPGGLAWFCIISYNRTNSKHCTIKQKNVVK
jgi:hypothetical protein